MAVNFLYRDQHGGEKLAKIKARVKIAATGVLVAMVMGVAGMLGASLYIGREKARLASDAEKLKTREVKLATAEARVWQLDDRAKAVLDELKSTAKIAERMRSLTPGIEIDLVSWSWSESGGQLEAEALYPELLERYADGLKLIYPKLTVTNVSWSENSKWRMSVELGGKIQ